MGYICGVTLIQERDNDNLTKVHGYRDNPVMYLMYNKWINLIQGGIGYNRSVFKQNKI